ncbi:MAG: hypothetical protein R2791_00915 [Saprospiraceae bacterium]
MHLFTIICEFRGGTFTRQMSAKDPVRAFEQWAAHFQHDNVLSPAEKEMFETAVACSLSENGLTAMENLQNVWYEGFSLGDDLLEVMVIAMSPAPVTARPAAHPAS